MPLLGTWIILWLEMTATGPGKGYVAAFSGEGEGGLKLPITCHAFPPLKVTTHAGEKDAENCRLPVRRWIHAGHK